MIRQRARTASTLLLATLVAACAACAADSHSRNSGSVADIDKMLTEGSYEAAVRKAAELREERGDDEASVAAHRRATVAYLLDHGRELTFEDKDEEALAVFERALELAPDSVQAPVWIQKTKDKIAEHWVVAGLEFHAQDNLEGAIEAYRKALRFGPGEESAQTGINSALLVSEYRKERGQEYLKKGLSARADYYLELALGELGRSRKYLREDDRIARNRSDVLKLLAEDRVLAGKVLEEEGHWAAARNEYRIALLENPDNKDAAAGFERARDESEVDRLVADARMRLVRGEYERAREDLAEARAKTRFQEQLVEELELEIAAGKHELMYQDALARERDGEYLEAIEAYGRLIDVAQYYKDALSRRKTLEDAVADAQEYYQRATAAQTPQEKLLLFKAINGAIWPGYRDVRERIRALEASLPPEPDPEVDDSGL